MESLYRFSQQIGFDHPLHPPFAHMPTGLVVGAFIFLLAALILRRHNMGATAYHCLVLALIFFFPTAFLGVTDWLHFYGGAWSFHIKMKIALSVLLLVLLAAGTLTEIKKSGGPMRRLAIYFLCVMAVVGLGYFGGQLVFADRGAAVSPDDAKEGERLYAVNCSGCHPNGGNVINPALPVIGSPQLKDPGTFVQFNRNPLKPDGSRGAMPAFPRERLSDQELKQIYQYITTVMAGKQSS
jgi:mono/diheme cytochrome c family protein